MFNNFFSKIVPFYEIMWKNNVERGRPQISVRRMLIACRITKATNTHPEYVIIIAFQLQEWLHDRASMLRYKYIACLICVITTAYLMSL
jgi:hypothetical protein